MLEQEKLTLTVKNIVSLGVLFGIIATLLSHLSKGFQKQGIEIFEKDKLLTPKKKRYIIAMYLVLVIIYELLLFIDTEGSLTMIYPSNPGEEPINAIFTVGSPIFIIGNIILLTSFILGFGFLYKSFQSKDIVKKKFLMISIGYFCCSSAGTLDGLVYLGTAFIFTRIVFLIREKFKIPSLLM